VAHISPAGDALAASPVLSCKRTYPTFRKDEMTDQRAETSRRPRPELSAAQVAGGALAAVTSAVAGSSLGVHGTVAGAAVGSVVATVGGELYTHSLRRTHETVRTVVARRGTPGTQSDAAATEPTAVISPEHAALGDAATTETPQDALTEMPQDTQTAILPQAAPQSWRGERSGPPLRRLAVVGAAAAGVFALSMGILSVGEVIAGRPVASVVSGDQGSGTTIGRTFDGGGTTPVEPAPTESDQSPQDEPGQISDTAPSGDSSPSPSTDTSRSPASDPGSSNTPAPQNTPPPEPRPANTP
jgi:hypothetical protein